MRFIFLIFIFASLFGQDARQYSAFTEWQAEIGGQIISMFRREPMGCGCENGVRLWAEPFGNWLTEKSVDDQTGFETRARGLSLGVDAEVIRHWIVGVGGAWDSASLLWKEGLGDAKMAECLGAVYSDYATDNFSVGMAFLAGLDSYHTNRNAGVEVAKGRYHALNLIGQVSGAYYIGPPRCCAFPYVNLDFMVLDQGKFDEHNALRFNQVVASNGSGTFRSEVGLGLSVQDFNRDETMCISPSVALGWSMEMPLFRENTEATLGSVTKSLPGWNRTWQLFSVELGLSFSYKVFLVGIDYLLEISTDTHTDFVGQRGNLHLDFRW